MSFDEITSDVQRRKKEVVLKHNGKEFKFFANEITYPQRLGVALEQHKGGDSLTQMIIFSITDEDGKNMTKEQAQKLSDEHAAILFEAASKVNEVVEEEKN